MLTPTENTLCWIMKQCLISAEVAVIVRSSPRTVFHLEIHFWHKILWLGTRLKLYQNHIRVLKYLLACSYWRLWCLELFILCKCLENINCLHFWHTTVFITFVEGYPDHQHKLIMVVAIEKSQYVCKILVLPEHLTSLTLNESPTNILN